MEFRRSRPDDAPAIRELELEYFSDPWSERDIFSAISTEGAMCYSAVGDDGSLVAYVIARLIAPEAEIYRVAVRTDKRRRGIGYRLLDYAIKTERGRGLESVFLEVRESNVPARNLYRAHGFREISLRKNYYHNPTENAVIMFKGNSSLI
jgi:ribosomal-protein-alanine N-acetyltransferase